MIRFKASPKQMTPRHANGDTMGAGVPVTASVNDSSRTTLASPMQTKMLMFLLSFLTILLFEPLGALAQSVYHVRSAATGNNSGTDWNNAFTSLPSSLVRGSTYYVADGSYPSYTFDDATDGTKYITIKKAIPSEHGSAVGWQDSYGDGVAEWAPTLKFKGSYYIFDGVTGGGHGQWAAGHGFRMASSENVMFIMLSDKWGGPSDRIDVSNITLSHVEIAGKTPVEPGVGTAIDATALDAKDTNIKISHCYIHDIGGPVFYWIESEDIVVERCYIARNATSPDHHGTGTRLQTANRVTYRWNFFEDMVGSGWVGGYDETGDAIEVYGNIFYCTPSFSGDYGNGVVYTISSTTSGINPRNWKVFNNTFVNLPNGHLIMLYVAGSNNVAYNNLFYRINGQPSFMSVDHDYSWFAEPSGTFGEANAQSASADPFVNLAGGNFQLRQATASGYRLDAPYNQDMLGNIRGSDGVWDRGALEFVGGADDKGPLAPNGLHIVTP